MNTYIYIFIYKYLPRFPLFLQLLLHLACMQHHDITNRFRRIYLDPLSLHMSAYVSIRQHTPLHIASAASTMLPTLTLLLLLHVCGAWTGLKLLVHQALSYKCIRP